MILPKLQEISNYVKIFHRTEIWNSIPYLKFVVWQGVKQFLHVKYLWICMTLKREKKYHYCSGTYLNSLKLVCKQIVYYLGHEVANFEFNVQVTGLLFSNLRPQYLCVCEWREFFPLFCSVTKNAQDVSLW